MWSPKQRGTIVAAAVAVLLVFGASRLLRERDALGGGVTRSEAATAVIQARGESPAAGCSVPFFSDVPCSHPGWGWIEKMRTNNLTHGCDPVRGLFCPDAPVSRAQMAMIVARSIAGGEDAVPVSYGPDPATGRSYSCDAGKPNLHFKDVTIPEIYCRHVNYLWAKGRMADSPDTYEPAKSMTRGEMAKFLAAGFGTTKAGS